MQRIYSDRESFGPEFDNRLIRLVKANPAIYDVSHKHYRRNPVRVAIWEKIAAELKAPSKFLQTKWKNIRYNYLQEIKCLETGHANANIRKRRFTEDLSFLQNTAQTYNVKKGLQKNSLHNTSSDNDSNSFLFAEAEPNAFEVIEIEHSDEASRDDFEEGVMRRNGYDVASFPVKCDLNELSDAEASATILPDDIDEPSPNVTIEQKPIRRDSNPMMDGNTHFYASNPSSPLLTPLVVMGNGHDNDREDIVTIEPITKDAKRPSSREKVPDIMINAAKRKAMQAPFPVLTPINDPIELYCLSLVDSLRSMPRSERERVKFEFAKILKDAKYKDDS